MINNEKCPCPRRQCERHGNCEECRANHAKKKQPMYCERRKRTKTDH